MLLVQVMIATNRRIRVFEISKYRRRRRAGRAETHGFALMASGSTQAAEARKREAIFPTGGAGRPSPESNNSRFRAAAKHMATPTSDSVSAATYDPPADRKSSTPAVPRLPASEAKGPIREREDVRPPKHTVSPPMRSTVSPAVDHAPRSNGPAGANGNVGDEYERYRAAREQMRRTPRDMPPGVEVLEVREIVRCVWLVVLGFTSLEAACDCGSKCECSTNGFGRFQGVGQPTTAFVPPSSPTGRLPIFYTF